MRHFRHIRGLFSGACRHAGAIALILMSSTQAHAASGATEQGRYLALTGDCAACHTAPGGKTFAGGLAIATPIGSIFATNITPSRTSGIGTYSLAQFDAALRRGIRGDGAHLYPAMPYTAYAKLSDADVAALYAYFMEAVAPVDATAQATKLPFPFNVRLSMAGWNLLFLDRSPFRPDPGHDAEWNRGAYLVQGLTHCGACHSPRNLLMAESTRHYLGGGDLGGWYAPNITSDANSGIGGWTTQEIADYLQGGRASGKAQPAGPMAEAVDKSLRHLTESDRHAIAVYLKSVPPLRDPSDTRPVFTWGAPADLLSAVRGAPQALGALPLSGAQLYDGACAACHGSRGQGAQGLPSLFHNTALGRANTNNLVLAILNGVPPGPEGMPMPGYARHLSDAQIATLGQYLMGHFGNPAGIVTEAQVRSLRTGAGGTSLVLLVQIAMAVCLFGFALLLWFLVRRWTLRRQNGARR